LRLVATPSASHQSTGCVASRHIASSHAVVHHTRTHCKRETRKMAEQTGASEPLGDATTGHSVDKEPSPTPVALAGRGKRGKNWSIDEQYALMDAYEKTTFDSERGANMTAHKYSEKLFKSFLSSPRCPSREHHTSRGAKHESLWYCRSPRSAKVQADSIRSDCIACNAAKRRARSFNVTGNLDEDKLWGAYLYVFNGGTCEPVNIYRFAN
jgi:hypothetical protein